MPDGRRAPDRVRPPRLAASPLARFAIVAAIAVVAAGVSMLEFLRSEPGNIDDGFILMVYVRHLIYNGSIAWNLGDGPVDGCTSMLDLLVKSAVVGLSGVDILWCTFLVTAILHVAVPLLAMAIILRLPAVDPGSRLLAAGAIGLILASMEAGAYAASFLLEMPLYLCCSLGLIGLVVLAPRFSVARMIALVVAAWMVVLARPEGLVLATVVLGAALWIERKHQPAVRLAAAFATFALGVAIYQAWHFLQFGAWAPNAYYAKTSARRANEILDGARYVLAFLSNASGWVQLGPALLSPLALLGSAWSSARARSHYALVSWTAAGMVAATIFSGGDSYPQGRLLVPSIALGAFAVALGLAHARSRLRTAFLFAAAAVTLVQGVRVALPRPLEWGSHVVMTTPTMRICEGTFANALRRVVPDGTIAQTDFQRLKYWCDPLRVLDLEGLSDREIAHQRVEEPVKLGKSSPEIVLRTQPEVWIPGYLFRTARSRVNGRPHPLLTSAETQMELLGYDERRKVAEGEVAAELARRYVPASLEVCQISYNLFVRSDLAKRFAEAGFTVEGY